MTEHHLCRTVTLRTHSFWQQRAGLEVKTKVTSKPDRWKESEKSSTKNCFFIVFFSIMSLSSKLLTCPPPTKKIRSQLKGCTQTTLSHRYFPANHCLAFSYSPEVGINNITSKVQRNKAQRSFQQVKAQRKMSS